MVESGLFDIVVSLAWVREVGMGQGSLVVD